MKRLFLQIGWLGLLGFGLGIAEAKTWIAASNPRIEKALEGVPTQAPNPASKVEWATLTTLERLELQAIQTQMFSPPRTARALAFLSVAMNDTLQLIGEKNIDPKVAITYAAQQVMFYLHPTFPNFKDAVRETVAKTVAKAKQQGVSPEGLEAAKQLGLEVGNQVAAFGRKDGANHQEIPTYPPKAPGVWVWPLGRPATEPGWGAVIPIAIAPNDLAQAIPPPAWDSPAYEQERKDFWAEQQKLDDHGKQIADFWAGDPGTVTPAGIWQEEAIKILQKENQTAEQAIGVLAILNVAMHDSFIACWKAKFIYYTARPNQWVATFDKKWKPYLRTPRFPAYPSGHSSVSGAAAGILKALFPKDAAQFDAMAKEASYSRIIAGIHWFVDGVGGLDLGQRIAQQVLSQSK